MSRTKPTVTFRYRDTDTTAPAYVNGVHGSISPRGDILMHFYHEHAPLPESLTHEIRADGTIGSPVSQVPPDIGSTFVRDIAGSIIMSHDSAKSIYQWLGERLKEMELIRSADAMFTESNEGGIVH